ncbi:hypothetical protein XENTR_v10004035 [Xenopus tropicalis]|nr:hypothetical protein XENTR_v10004035 [Xenopus tropicalis]
MLLYQCVTFLLWKQARRHWAECKKQAQSAIFKLCTLPFFLNCDYELRVGNFIEWRGRSLYLAVCSYYFV